MIIRTDKHSLLFKILTITLYKTKNKERANRSRFDYVSERGYSRTIYRLRLLGVLHGLFGLTLEVSDDDENRFD